MKEFPKGELARVADSSAHCNFPEPDFWKVARFCLPLGLIRHGDCYRVRWYSAMFRFAYLRCSLLSASFLAVSSASAAFTFTSGSTPTPSQSAFPKGLIAFSSGMPIPK